MLPFVVLILGASPMWENTFMVFAERIDTIEFVEVETRKMFTLFSSEDFLLFALTAKFME